MELGKDERKCRYCKKVFNMRESNYYVEDRKIHFCEDHYVPYIRKQLQRPMDFSNRKYKNRVPVFVDDEMAEEYIAWLIEKGLSRFVRNRKKE